MLRDLKIEVFYPYPPPTSLAGTYQPPCAGSMVDNQ